MRRPWFEFVTWTTKYLVFTMCDFFRNLSSMLELWTNKTNKQNCYHICMRYIWFHYMFNILCIYGWSPWSGSCSGKNYLPGLLREDLSTCTTNSSFRILILTDLKCRKTVFTLCYFLEGPSQTSNFSILNCEYALSCWRHQKMLGMLLTGQIFIPQRPYVSLSP